MGYILLGIMYICLGIYMVVLMMNVVRKCRKTHSEYYKREIPLMVAPDKKTLKKSVKSMFFMVQTRCEVETIKY